MGRPDTSSEEEVVRFEHERLIELERQLLAMRVAQTERDQRIVQLTGQLVLKSALLEHAEANVAEAKRRAGLEQRELQAKLDELLLSRDRAVANAAEANKCAVLEQRKLQAKLDELLLFRDQAEANVAEAKQRTGLERRELQAKLNEMRLSHDQAEVNAAEAKQRAGLEQRELQAKLDETRLSRDQADANAAKAKKRAELEQRELQAKVDELLLSRDQALEQAQSALQKASCAAEANEQSQRELTEMRAELEARKSESAALRLQLADTENGISKSKKEANYRTQAATGLVNTDEDRVVHRLMERVRAMEAEMASLRWNEKSFEMMECSNEG